MKIRTGFVTNSSSYSSAVISIESKELAALLKQCEGLLGATILSDDKKFDAYWEEGTNEICEMVPKTLDAVLDSLIKGFSCLYDIPKESRDALDTLIQELEMRKAELTASIRKVDWWYENDSYGEFEPDDARKKAFTYNRRSKKTGGAGVYEES